MHRLTRRTFLTSSALSAAASLAPVTLVKTAFSDSGEGFNFAFITDSHLQHIRGSKFVRTWDTGLKSAIAEILNLSDKPDFIVYGGDISQRGKAEEIDHGRSLLSPLTVPQHWVIGEHDYYRDHGEYWMRSFGSPTSSWNHKGVHFIKLNSVLTRENWMNAHPDGQERIALMGGQEAPIGAPFMVGMKQRLWLKNDLKTVSKDTPIVIFSHSPLQKLNSQWNFWTEDADDIHVLLAPFKTVSVLYGHTHQVQQSQIGNITFHGVSATAWKWPSHINDKSISHLPTLTLSDSSEGNLQTAPSWHFINVWNGKVELAV